jgi:hypothetical protein
MKPFRSMALALACALPLIAWSQYQWIDKDGRKVFSDRPPPSDVPAAKVLRSPKGQAAAPAPVSDTAAAPSPTSTSPAAAAAASAAANAASAARAAGSAPKLTGKDKELEDKKKQAEAAAAAKKKEEEAKYAEAQADNCKRAKSSKMAFDSGQRITRMNEKGEREVLDDKQRAEEAARLDGVIARDCKGAQ